MKPRIEVFHEVIKDMQGRRAKGILSYGGPLTTRNGRDALQDAYEEAMDLVMYLKQAILERNTDAANDHPSDESCLEAGQGADRRS